MTLILIVDDDKFTRTVLENVLLRDRNCQGLAPEVVTAANGQEGLQVFRERRPQVVISDLLMPVMDGFELCRRLRDEPGGNDALLIVLSGAYRDRAVSERLASEHDVAFFTKPYQLRDMTSFLVKRLGREEPSAQPDGAASPATAARALPGRGELRDRPLPALLLDLLEAEATGRLWLRRGRVAKTCDLLCGHPVSAASNARDETLGHYLVARGVIDQPVHERAVRLAAARKEKLGQILIEHRLLTPESLVEHLTGQIRFKIVQSLRWPDGVWRFERTQEPPPGARGNAIDATRLILDGLRDTESADLAVRRSVELSGRALQLNERGMRLLPELERTLSTRLASAFVGGTSVDGLLGAGLSQTTVASVLDILVLCDAVDIGLPVASDATVAAEIADPPSGGISIAALSAHSSQSSAAVSGDSPDLYSLLFEESGPAEPRANITGAVPLEIDPRAQPVAEDRPAAAPEAEEAATPDDQAQARRALLTEYLRIQSIDHYALLEVTRDALPGAIAAAAHAHHQAFAHENFASFDLGRDYAKLEELHAAYDRAARILTDPTSRRQYDDELAHAGINEVSPSLDGELAFNAASELIEQGRLPEAIEKLEAAVRSAPNEADYHATLGWVLYVAGRRTAQAADQARPHINQALAVNPDHVLAHEYKGIISAELRSDDAEAVFHLGRALEIDPMRSEALRVLVELHLQRDEIRPLERLYRRLIHRVAGKQPQKEFALWCKLAELYRSKLGELEHARIALESAARLAPEDPGLQAMLAQLTQPGGSERGPALPPELRRRLCQGDPAVARDAGEQVRIAENTRQYDSAFLLASVLVARGLADPETEALYQRYRPRFVVRAQQTFDPRLWEQVRHPDDLPEVSALFDLIAPVLDKAMPISPGELGLDEAGEIPDAELPEAVVRTRAYVAHMLGVGVPRILLRPGFGRQIHVAALDPPLLLAGEEALAAPERGELCFRLGRAMTYLLPGRAIGGSRPTVILKQAVLAAFATVSPDAHFDDPDGSIASLVAELRALPAERRNQIHSLVYWIGSRNREVDLSRWVWAMGRTANRVGLTLLGDLPAAQRFAREATGEPASDDLVDYALGPGFAALRVALGLSIEV
jgi:CheY-like chemotaxis protein